MLGSKKEENWRLKNDESSLPQQATQKIRWDPSFSTPFLHSTASWAAAAVWKAVQQHHNKMEMNYNSTFNPFVVVVAPHTRPGVRLKREINGLKHCVNGRDAKRVGWEFYDCFSALFFPEAEVEHILALVEWSQRKLSHSSHITIVKLVSIMKMRKDWGRRRAAQISQ